MNFTVVRAVRGGDAMDAEPGDRLPRPSQAVPPAPARMDLPYADEVLHLDLADFAPTIPADLPPP